MWEDSWSLVLFFTQSISFGSSFRAYLLLCEQKTEHILPKVYRSRKQTLKKKTKKLFYSTTTSKNNGNTVGS